VTTYLPADDDGFPTGGAIDILPIQGRLVVIRVPNTMSMEGDGFAEIAEELKQAGASTVLVIHGPMEVESFGDDDLALLGLTRINPVGER